MLRFSVQRNHYGFKVIGSGIFFTEPSDYFYEICNKDLVHKFDTSMSQMVKGLFTEKWHMTGFQLFCIVTSATCGAGNVHLFRNT